MEIFAKQMFNSANPKGFGEVEDANNKPITDFFDERLNELKKEVILGKVVKGLREVTRALQKDNVVKIFLAKDETLNGQYGNYIKTIVSTYNANSDKKIDIIYFKNYALLRDVVLRGSVQFVDALRDKPNKGPKCYVAAIIEKAQKKDTSDK